MSEQLPQAAAGWYAPDPNRPRLLRYWDGTAWTDNTSEQSVAPVISPSRGASENSWWTSWPAIIAGFVLCLLPGLVLLLGRRGTAPWVKVAVSVAALSLFGAAGQAASDNEPKQPAPVVVPAEASVASEPLSPTPSPSPSPSPTPSFTPSPSPSPSPTPVAPPPAPEPPQAPVEEPAPPAPQTDPRYPYCKDLPAGYGPYYQGVDPEYEWYRDADHDGVVCE